MHTVQVVVEGQGRDGTYQSSIVCMEVPAPLIGGASEAVAAADEKLEKDIARRLQEAAPSEYGPLTPRLLSRNAVQARQGGGVQVAQQARRRLRKWSTMTSSHQQPPVFHYLKCLWMLSRKWHRGRPQSGNTISTTPYWTCKSVIGKQALLVTGQYLNKCREPNTCL